MQMTEWSSSGNSSFSHINRWLRYHSKSLCQSECIPVTGINIAAGQTQWLPAELGVAEVCLPRKLLRLIRDTQNYWKMKWISMPFGRTSYSDLTAVQEAFTWQIHCFSACASISWADNLGDSECFPRGHIREKSRYILRFPAVWARGLYLLEQNKTQKFLCNYRCQLKWNINICVNIFIFLSGLPCLQEYVVSYGDQSSEECLCTSCRDWRPDYHRRW